MKTVRTEAPQPPPNKLPRTLRFTAGLLGFEQEREFVLHPAAPNSPYLWLEIAGQPGQGFVVISPSCCVPAYAPDIGKPDVEMLSLGSADDAFVLNIVTIGPRGEATLNLRAPLVVNRHTFAGKQCVPANVSTFSLHHPIQSLPAAAA